jgi:uracil-DNA glycosylase
VLIASQAPGTKVHHAGISFWDQSGARLRGWLGMDKALFYDASQVAILPAGMCYPGRLPNGGDAPPRPECAKLWRERVLAVMPELRLTLLVGSYAQSLALGPGKVGERVRNFGRFLPRYFPLPHPSWRTGAWERANPWFAQEVLPALRGEVAGALAANQGGSDEGLHSSAAYAPDSSLPDPFLGGPQRTERMPQSVSVRDNALARRK